MPLGLFNFLVSKFHRRKTTCRSTSFSFEALFRRAMGYATHNQTQGRGECGKGHALIIPRLFHSPPHAEAAVFGRRSVILCLMDSFVSEISSQHIWETQEWEALKAAVPSIEKLHLRQLLQVGSGVEAVRRRTRTVSTSFRSNMTTSFLTTHASGLPLKLKW